MVWTDPPRRRSRRDAVSMSLGAGMFATLAAGLGAGWSPLVRADAAAKEAAAPGRAFEFAFDGIDGAPLALSAYAGRPLLVVNTASRCGFTPQYDGLQSLWARYRDRGLLVLGVPSNDFRQELASADAVKDFCEVNFGLDFPLTEITRVTGDGAHPFFAWAAEELGAPRWNFTKYLVAPDGRLHARYGSNTTPEQIAPEIERLLAQAGL